MAESLAPATENQQSNGLTPHFEQIASCLFENANRSDAADYPNVFLLAASYGALAALCQNSCEQSLPLIQQMLMPILNQLEQTLQFTDHSQKLQDLLCGLVQVIMMKVGDNIDDETGNKIVQLIIMIFKNLQKVTENGLIAYQGVVVGLGNRVNIRDFGDYIIWALEGEDEECCRLACGIISDIAAALEEGINVYLSSFVPNLLKVLKSETRERRSKLAAFDTIDNISLYSGDSFCKQYMVETC